MKQILPTISFIFMCTQIACGPGDYYEFSDLLANSAKRCAIELKRGNIILSIKNNSDQPYGYSKTDLENGKPGTKLRCAKDKHGDDNCAIFIFEPPPNECFVLSRNPKRPKTDFFARDYNNNDCVLSPQLKHEIVFRNSNSSTTALCINNE